MPEGHEYVSANYAKGGDCECGADKHNTEVERVFAEALRIASNGQTQQHRADELPLKCVRVDLPG